MQTALVLVGVPGAGKTTIAEQLLAASSGWCWINQDSLGDRRQCEEEFKLAVQQGKDIIVDRCNHTVKQRETWVQLALEMQRRRGLPLQLLCLALETLPAECKRRAVARTVHATLSAEDAPHVIDRFQSEYQAPSTKEGFHQVYRVTTPEDVHSVLHTYLLPLHGAGWLQQQQIAQHGACCAPSGSGQPGLPHQTSAAAWECMQACGGSSSSHSGGLQPSRQGQQQPHVLPAQSSAQRGYATASGLHVQAQQQPWGHQQGQAGGHADANGAGLQQQPQPQPSSTEPRDKYVPLHRRGSLPPRDAASPRKQDCQQQAARTSNIVPFGQRSPRADAAPHGWAGQQAPEFLDEDDDPRPILLWDMNGTLTSHTHQRRSTGKNLARPGTHHLRRLTSKFRLGVFTSASQRTVRVALDMLEREAGAGPPVFDRRLLLHRVHTQPVEAAHIEAGGNPWDTVKPLHRYFKRLHRVILVDDDEYKALPSETGNLLHVPCWQHEDPSDCMVQHFVEVLLEHFGALQHDDDVREHTAAASQTLHAIADRYAAAVEGMQQPQQPRQEEDADAEGAANGGDLLLPKRMRLSDSAEHAGNPEEIEIDMGED